MQYAVEIELDHEIDQWPTAAEIRKALEEKLRLGDLELEQSVHEVLE
jgi:hypothetical protein